MRHCLSRRRREGRGSVQQRDSGSVAGVTPPVIPIPHTAPPHRRQGRLGAALPCQGRCRWRRSRAACAADPSAAPPPIGSGRGARRAAPFDSCWQPAQTASDGWTVHRSVGLLARAQNWHNNLAAARIPVLFGVVKHMNCPVIIRKGAILSGCCVDRRRLGSSGHLCSAGLPSDPAACLTRSGTTQPSLAGLRRPGAVRAVTMELRSPAFTL